MNPLQRREDHFEKDDPGRRRSWFNCACCPPNIMRLLASLDKYFATTAAGTLYVHHYAGARLAGAGLDVELITDYPWSGQITLRVLGAPADPRGLALRIPAWSTATTVKVNDSPQRAVAPDSGYLTFHQQGRPGDEITLDLDMPALDARRPPGRRRSRLRGHRARPARLLLRAGRSECSPR